MRRRMRGAAGTVEGFRVQGCWHVAENCAKGISYVPGLEVLAGHPTESGEAQGDYPFQRKLDLSFDVGAAHHEYKRALREFSRILGSSLICNTTAATTPHVQHQTL